jgi:hypothetical protein
MWSEVEAILGTKLVQGLGWAGLAGWIAVMFLPLTFSVAEIGGDCLLLKIRNSLLFIGVFEEEVAHRN